MKNRIIILTVTVAACLTIGIIHQSFAHEKQKKNPRDVAAVVRSETKAEIQGSGVSGRIREGVVGGISEGVQESIQGGIIGGVLSPAEEDFLQTPMTIIELKIESLEIKPDKTIPLTEVTVRALNEKPVSYTISGETLFGYDIKVELTPVIIEDQGIELSVKVTSRANTHYTKKILVRNLESAYFEILESKDNKTKIANKITPIISVIKPAKDYSHSLERIAIINAIFIMNDEVISRNFSLTGEGMDPIFYFYIKDKGIYVLSFSHFEGAEPTGVVNSNTIRIKHKDDYFEWISMKSILPPGKWRVWVRNDPSYLPDERMGKLGSNFFGICDNKMSWKKFFKELK